MTATGGPALQMPQRRKLSAIGGSSSMGCDWVSTFPHMPVLGDGNTPRRSSLGS